MKYIVIFFVMFTSCGIEYRIGQGLPAKDVAANNQLLLGSYQNTLASNPYDSTVLWDALTKKAKKLFKTQTADDMSQSVSIVAVSKKTIKLHLIENKKVMDSFLLKGKFADSSFYVNKRRYFLGLPPIFVRSSGYKIILTKGGNDSLLLDTYQHDFGWILLLHAGRTQPAVLRYAIAK